MGNLLNFDARTVQPQVGIDPVPEGWYKCVVVKSNNKAVSTGNGGMLELQLQIIEGQFQNRVIYWNLNLYNTNAQAVEISYKQLSALCHVIGQYQIQDTNTPDNMVPALHNIPFFAHAIIAQGNQGAINNIKGVRDINGNDPGKAGAPQGGPQGGAGPAAWSPPQGGGSGAAPSNNPNPNPPNQSSWGAPANNQNPNPPNNPQGGWSPPQGAPQGGQGGWSPPQGGAPQGGPQGGAGPAAWSPPQGGGSGAAAPWQR